MREIKFRGYSKEKGWVYGFICKSAFETIEMQDVQTNEKVEIDIDSIGQYTGYKDKNGVEIYEGDIVEYVSDTLMNEDNKVFIVEWETQTNNGWIIRNYNYYDETAIDNKYLSYWLNDYIDSLSEVIGNIYERNKENGI